jgi:hypothetical protein
MSRLSDFQRRFAEVLGLSRFGHAYNGDCIGATASQVGRHLRSQGISVRDERAGRTEHSQREAKRLLREARGLKRRKAG